jgi:hypothetical protein
MTEPLTREEQTALNLLRFGGVLMPANDDAMSACERLVARGLAFRLKGNYGRYALERSAGEKERAEAT